MTAGELLDELNQLRIEISIEHGKLRVTDTLGILDAEGWDYIARHKADYIAALTPAGSRCADCGDTAALVMMAMAPGPDGQPWALCGRCYA